MSPLRGTPVGRARRHAIFCALYPPEETANQIWQFTDGLFETGTLKGRRVPRERLHISLNSFGSFLEPPELLIAKASVALSTLRWPSFKLGLNRLISFNNAELQPRVLSGDEGLIGIDLLYDAIYLNLRSAGLRLPHPRLTPHLTLSREKHMLPDEYIIETVSWRVSDFRLIHSPRGDGRHHVLGSWPLQS
jgi:2'-5' RNA ligase